MTITLQQPTISRTSKFYQILLVNFFIIGATVLGYKYLPSIIALDVRHSSRFIVLVVMAPVFALYCSIAIGIKQPKRFSANKDGITFSSASGATEFYPWHDISSFSLNPNSKVLKFRVDSLQLKQTFRLKQFGITKLQLEQLQQLAAVWLKGE